MMLYTTSLKDAAPTEPTTATTASQNDNNSYFDRRPSGSLLARRTSSNLRSALLASSQQHSSDRMLSKSLGDGGLGASLMGYQRCSSEVSHISYSGYLLKRSNHPFRKPVAPIQLPFESPVPPRFYMDAPTMTEMGNGNGRNNNVDERILIPADSSMLSDQSTNGPYIQKPVANRIAAAYPSTRILHRPRETQPNEDIISQSTNSEVEDQIMDQTMGLAAAFFGLDIDETIDTDQQLQQQPQHITNEIAEGNNYSSFSPLDRPLGNESQCIPDDMLDDPNLLTASSRSAPISMASTSTVSGPTINDYATMVYNPSAPYPINPSSPGPVGPNLRAPPRRQDSAPATLSTPQSGIQSEHGSIPSSSYRTQPNDFIDESDGHIWRAKYCVLEDGVLYFYRNASDGDSLEAQQERERMTYTQHNSSDHLDDLGKSPMTRSPAMLNPHHREKNGSFCHDMNYIWEKRVKLDCVGAVRSAEQEYGGCSLELLAIGSEEDDANESEGTEETSSVGTSTSSDAEAAAHVDRLVLRAGSKEEMKEWLFQFHRSLASFMKQIMNSVGSPGILYPTAQITPGMPGFAYDNNVGGYGGKHTGERDSPTLHGTSLSHGHGRNGLHRRRVRAHQHHGRSKGGTQPTSAASTPGGGASPVYLQQKFVNFNRSSGDLQLPLYQGTDETQFEAYEQKFKDKFNQKAENELKPASASTPVTLPCLKHPGNNAAIEREESTATTHTATTQATTVASSSPDSKIPLPSPKAMPLSSGKYIPPHLRNKQQNGGGGSGSNGGISSGKYVPPHLRKKSGAGGSAAPTVSNLSKKLELSSNDSQGKSDGNSNGIFEMANDDAIEDEKQMSSCDRSDISHEAQTIPKKALRPKTESEKKAMHFKLGGCADPTVAVASILDPIYTSRKASKVGNVHSDPYGNFGGTFKGESSFRTGDCSTCAETTCDVRWEVGAVSECGIRESNEDAYLISNNLYGAFTANERSSLERSSSPEKDASLPGAPTGEICDTEQQEQPGRKDQGLFAIFDGHCGNQAARYAAEKFPSFLFDEITKLCEDDPTVSFAAEEHAESILISAMARLDDEFCRFCTFDGRDWESGATALVTLISDGFIAIANLGDCKGVMCSSISSPQIKGDTDDGSKNPFSNIDGWQLLEDDDYQDYDNEKWDRATGGDISTHKINCYWKEVTESHSPSRDDEQQRILDAKGWITSETEIPIGQLKRMDFADKDVVEILRRCFSDRLNEHVSGGQSAGKKGHHAEPGRMIEISRICGELAVSRAIGDRDFKAAYNRVEDTEDDSASRWEGPLFLPYPEQHDGFFKGDLVSPTPEIQVERIGRLGAFDEFLLLACDGLWDVMDADDAVRVTRSLLFEKKWSAKEAAARLAELAIHLGSSDNITVIVISFSSRE